MAPTYRSPVAPMLATAGDLPLSEGWSYEPKWDGMRVVAHVGSRFELRSRNLKEATGAYPELAGLADVTAGADAILDGEVVAIDESGRPSFQRLQERMHRRSPSAELVARVPVSFVAFDLLWWADQPLFELPYEARRQLLVDLDLTGPRWRTAPAFDGDGPTVAEQSEALGFEGVVAKRHGSLYRPGARSRDWIKTKVQRSDEFVVVGWLPGEGRRDGTVGSLVIAAHGDDGLVLCGTVGSGLRADDLDHFSRLPRRSEGPPGRLPTGWHGGGAARGPVTWVEPTEVIEVRYTERTDEGALRHPVYRGRRPDKHPDEVRLPEDR